MQKKTFKTYVGSISNFLNGIGNHVSSCKSDFSKLEARQAEYNFIVAYSDSCVNKKQTNYW